MEGLEIDQIFEEIGEFGRHQKKIYFALSFTQVYASWHMLQLVFVGAKPSFSCNTSAGLSNATCAANCTGYVYTSQFTSIATEWDLVCKNAYKTELATSIYMAGVLLGVFSFGSLSDKIGRLKTIYISISLLLLLSLSSSFAPTYNVYVSLRFLSGISCGGVLLVPIVLTTEVMGPSKRALGAVFTAFFSIGLVIFCGMAYFIRDWRYLSIATSLPGVLTIAYIWLIPESPRWLFAQGKTERARRVLVDIAVGNNSRFPIDKIQLREPEIKKKKSNESFVKLCTHFELRKRTLIQVYAWFVLSICYYGLTMAASNLGSNLYFSTLLSGVAEFPGYVVVLFLINRYGRRNPMSVLLILGGIACCCILAVPSKRNYSSYVVIGLSLVGKLCASTSFAIVYVQSAELYPTSIRNVGMGTCSMAARLGGIIAPFIIPMGTIYPQLQFAVFGGLAFTAGVLNFFLPETLNKPLPERIEDLDDENKTTPRWYNEERVGLIAHQIESNEMDNDDNV